MKTVLLIDDDAACQAPVVELFEKLHWQVLVARGGEDGLALALAQRPDLIICDLLLPGTNGFHLCRAVRECLDLRHTRIIVCAGHDFASDRKLAAEAGADLYLLKPVSLSSLEEAVQGLALCPSEECAAPSGTSPVPAAAPKTPADGAARIKFWGVRGSVPTPGASTVFFGGNTSCVELRALGQIVVLDAGSGIRPLGLQLAREFKNQPIDLTLLITHTHWDHIQGFPFFLPAYDAKNKVHVLGYEGARDGLRATLAGQMESPYFPIALNQMPGNIVIEELKELHFSIGDLPAQACFTNHPGVCVGYRLETREGAVVYMPDNETFPLAGGYSHEDEAVCSLQSKVLEFVRDAEVFIADAQYDCLEYQSHVGWGHGCLDDVVRLAIEANVKRLYLFHHDPAHDDRFISSMLMHARSIAAAAQSTLRVYAAREGEEVLILARESAEIQTAAR